MAKSSKKNSKKNRSKNSKKSGRVSSSLKLYVAKAISKHAETKVKSTSYSITTFNSAINSTPDLIKVLPQIGNGTDSSARIGNQISPTKLVIRGYVIYDSSVAGAQVQARMIGARLFCFSDKTTKSYANSIYNYNLLEEGDSTSGEWTGQTICFSRPHNADQFKWYADKRMKILKPYGLTSNSGAGSTPIASMHSSMYHPFVITITKKNLPSKLTYDATDSTVYPVNFAPQLALGYCDLLGGSPDSTTTQIAMQFESTLYFKDC